MDGVLVGRRVLNFGHGFLPFKEPRPLKKSCPLICGRCLSPEGILSSLFVEDNAHLFRNFIVLILVRTTYIHLGILSFFIVEDNVHPFRNLIVLIWARTTYIH